MSFVKMSRLWLWIVISSCVTSRAFAQASGSGAADGSALGAGRAEAEAAAAAPLASTTWGERRVLDGHRFPIAAFVPNPLPSSYLGVRAGLEYHEVPGYAELPTLGTTSTPQQVDLKTIDVAETLDFSIRLHDYVALFGDAYGRARVGANTSTLLGTGADYTYGGDAGVLAKIVRVGGFQLAVRGQFGMYAGQSAGILTLFQDLNRIASNAIMRVEQNPTTDLNAAINQLNASFRNATADLLTPFTGVTWGGSVNFAQAIGRFVGVQGSLGFLYDAATYNPTMIDVSTSEPLRSTSRTRTLRPNLAIAIDLDLSPVRVPLDLMLEYRATPVSVKTTTTGTTADGSDSQSAVEQLFAVGIYYSGRSDLQLGVTGYALSGQIPALGANAQPSGQPLDLGLQFVFRYFW
ncbi:MAG TPA: hypothetical protein VGI70_09485 [Polyangiales bacterium]